MNTTELRIEPGSMICAESGSVSCDIEGEAVILNLTSGVYFGLNPVGAEIWKQVASEKTFTALCEYLMSRYTVDRQRCEAELNTLLREMQSHGLIRIREVSQSRKR